MRSKGNLKNARITYVSAATKPRAEMEHAQKNVDLDSDLVLRRTVQIIEWQRNHWTVLTETAVKMSSRTLLKKTSLREMCVTRDSSRNQEKKAAFYLYYCWGSV